MSFNYPRSLACGDSGVSIEFGNTINELVNQQVLALDSLLVENNLPGIIETVPTYRALLIHYDPVEVTYDEVAAHALALAAGVHQSRHTGRLLNIPVCYEAEFGIDLIDVAERLGVRPSQVIDLHTASEYRVYMLGFQPGFAYLGGIDPALSLPRRARPRHGAPAGTISIATQQCAVHAVEGPSGWHWIGRTPLPTYEDSAIPRCVIEPGDRIRFHPITAQVWHKMRLDVADGASLLEVAI
jgi:KipI family sensor histidine kinase inhibitor